MQESQLIAEMTGFALQNPKTVYTSPTTQAGKTLEHLQLCDSLDSSGYPELGLSHHDAQDPSTVGYAIRWPSWCAGRNLDRVR